MRAPSGSRRRTISILRRQEAHSRVIALDRRVLGEAHEVREDHGALHGHAHGRLRHTAGATVTWPLTVATLQRQSAPSPVSIVVRPTSVRQRVLGRTPGG